MTEDERVRAWFHRDGTARICMNCAYFYQHYVKNLDPNADKFGWEYTPIMDGHCSRPRWKRRRADAEPCDLFVFREAQEKS